MSKTPELSSCFFQNLFENKLTEPTQPVLQVLESRFLAGAQQSVRLRLSDGIFSYSGCGVITNLGDRFREDGLLGANAIIRVLDYSVTCRGPRPAFTIMEYDLISLDYPPIGNPVSHNATSRDYMQDHSKSVKRETDGLDNECNLEPPPKRAPTGVSNNNISENTRSIAGVRNSTNGNNSYKTENNFNGPRYELTQISFITPYINKWRILGVVSNKENIRDIRSPKGQFRVFSFTVTDQQSNSIKISGFGEQADKFHPIITDGKAYYISGSGSGSVRSANKSYNTTGHDYELCLQRDSEINECKDQHVEQPKFKLNVVPLNRIREHIGECVDILGIIDRVNEISQVTTRADGRQLNKRDIFLLDKSGVEITFTLWGEKVSDLTSENVGEVLGIKGATIKEFNGGISLGSTSGTIIKNNPEGTASNELYVWYTQDRPNTEIKSLSTALEAISFERDLRLIGLAVQHGIGKDSEKGAYFNITALVTAVKSETAIYQACINENCRKKVVSQNNQYRCEKCNSTSDSFKNCLMLSVELADLSGSAWTTIFEEKAFPFLGVKADDLAKLQRTDNDAYEAVFDKIRFHMFNFRVRVKYEMYNDQQQMRWSVYEIKPVPVERCKSLYLEIIEKNKTENF